MHWEREHTKPRYTAGQAPAFAGLKGKRLFAVSCLDSLQLTPLPLFLVPLPLLRLSIPACLPLSSHNRCALLQTPTARGKGSPSKSSTGHICCAGPPIGKDRGAGSTSLLHASRVKEKREQMRAAAANQRWLLSALGVLLLVSCAFLLPVSPLSFSAFSQCAGFDGNLDVDAVAKSTMASEFRKVLAWASHAPKLLVWVSHAPVDVILTTVSLDSEQFFHSSSFSGLLLRLWVLILSDGTSPSYLPARPPTDCAGSANASHGQYHHPAQDSSHWSQLHQQFNLWIVGAAHETSLLTAQLSESCKSRALPKPSSQWQTGWTSKLRTVIRRRENCTYCSNDRILSSCSSDEK